ncbi:MAG TPA: arginine--tRNA ligase [Chloroflexi bacterium]|nr:arginine--tRNA ligase [Chloroflexota bacterium]
MTLLPDRIASLIREAIQAAQDAGDLPAFSIPSIPVERPRQATFGDFASPVCLQLAPLARMAPLRIAEQVAAHLPPADFVGRVEVARPGYINLTLDEGWLARQVETILAAGDRWGAVDVGRGERIQVEYVSANPTGPLTVGSGRNAVLGDGLASVLEAAGYRVQREYYVNDAGSQMQKFAETLYARYAQALGHDIPIPEDGYRGSYMVELGRAIAQEEGERYLQMDRDRAVEALRDEGLRRMLETIREDLALLGIHFDRWFSERSLYEDGTFETVMQLLRERGYLEEREGAIWFKATLLGGDKDEVVVRSNGEPGYFASDIAYHYDKFVRRGFDRVIDVWGADHQGHVPRMKAMMKALGLDPDRLIIVIYQLVTLTREGVEVRLSKRTGEIVTLRELVEEVGPDAVRFFLLSREANSQMEFDLSLAKQESEKNPVYYVQYAHARIASILRKAAADGWEATSDRGDVTLLTHPGELALIRKMLELPEVVALSARQMSPHFLPHYAQDLAAAFHAFYRDCRVLDPANEALSYARLKLVRTAKQVLARTLGLMGMSAPETM